MLGNREDAEEAAQDVFLKVYRAGDTFRSESTTATWIYRITANVCIDRLRRKQIATTSMEAPVGDDGITLADTIKDPAPGPDALCVDKETAETVRRMVRNLPPDWAMALTLYHFDSRGYEEIAEIMELPVSTVGTYIRRGRQRLARELTASLTIDTQPASRDTGS